MLGKAFKLGLHACIVIAAATVLEKTKALHDEGETRELHNKVLHVHEELGASNFGLFYDSKDSFNSRGGNSTRYCFVLSNAAHRGKAQTPCDTQASWCCSRKNKQVKKVVLRASSSCRRKELESLHWTVGNKKVHTCLSDDKRIEIDMPEWHDGKDDGCTVDLCVSIPAEDTCTTIEALCGGSSCGVQLETARYTKKKGKTTRLVECSLNGTVPTSCPAGSGAVDAGYGCDPCEVDFYQNGTALSPPLQQCKPCPPGSVSPTTGRSSCQRIPGPAQLQAAYYEIPSLTIPYLPSCTYPNFDSFTWDAATGGPPGACVTCPYIPADAPAECLRNRGVRINGRADAVSGLLGLIPRINILYYLLATYNGINVCLDDSTYQLPLPLVVGGGQSLCIFGISKENTVIQEYNYQPLDPIPQGYASTEFTSHGLVAEGGFFYSSNITFDGQNTYPGLHLNNSYAILEEVAITRQSNPSQTGGALYVNSSVVELRGRVDLHENDAGQGGGIYLSNGSSLLVKTVDSGLRAYVNRATQGGFMYCQDSSIFEDTSGSLYATNVATGSTILGGGGAFYMANCSATFGGDLRVEFNRATASSGGGIFAQNGSSIIFTGSTLLDSNSARQNGGGVYLANGSMRSSPSGGLVTWKLNSAYFGDPSDVYGNGGGLYLTESGYASFGPSRFEYCAASAGTGGAIHMEANSSLELYESTVLQENFGLIAGGIYLGYNNTLTLGRNVTLALNVGFSAAMYSAGNNTIYYDAIVQAVNNSEASGEPPVQYKGKATTMNALNRSVLTFVSPATFSGNLPATEPALYVEDSNFILRCSNGVVSFSGGACDAREPCTEGFRDQVFECTGCPEDTFLKKDGTCSSVCDPRYVLSLCFSFPPPGVFGFEVDQSDLASYVELYGPGGYGELKGLAFCVVGDASKDLVLPWQEISLQSKAFCIETYRQNNYQVSLQLTTPGQRHFRASFASLFLFGLTLLGPSSGAGGGVVASDSSVEMFDSTITGCTTPALEANGGGLSLVRCNLTNYLQSWSNAIITNCTATAKGGAMYLEDTRALLNFFAVIADNAAPRGRDVFALRSDIDLYGGNSNGRPNTADGWRVQLSKVTTFCNTSTTPRSSYIDGVCRTNCSGSFYPLALQCTPNCPAGQVKSAIDGSCGGPGSPTAAPTPAPVVNPTPSPSPSPTQAPSSTPTNCPPGTYLLLNNTCSARCPSTSSSSADGCFSTGATSSLIGFEANPGSLFPRLVDELAGSSAGVAVCLLPGTYDFTAPVVLAFNQSICLEGPGADTTVLQASVAGMGRHFDLSAGSSNIVLHGLTLQGLAPLQQAGGISMTQGTGTFRGVTFSNIRNFDLDGGALDALLSALDFGDGTVFTGNAAQRGGGGFYAGNSSVIMGSSCVVKNNQATFGPGGGIFVDNSSLIIGSDLDMSENFATDTGGAMFVGRPVGRVVIGPGAKLVNNAINGVVGSAFLSRDSSVITIGSPFTMANNTASPKPAQNAFQMTFGNFTLTCPSNQVTADDCTSCQKTFDNTVVTCCPSGQPDCSSDSLEPLGRTECGITSFAPYGETFFGAQDPEILDFQPETPLISVGHSFYVTAPGIVTAIRFFLAIEEELGGQEGRIIDQDGTTLASVIFDSVPECFGGEWVSHTLPSVVPVYPGRIYTVTISRLTHYVSAPKSFEISSPTSNLVAVPNPGFLNIGPGSTTNYFVDVVYSTVDAAPLFTCAKFPPAPVQTLFSRNDVPASLTDNGCVVNPFPEGSLLIIGVTIQPAHDGVISAIRFFKPHDEPINNLHIGKVYTAGTGSTVRLAEVAFGASSCCRGDAWLSQALPTPLQVMAGEMYAIVVENVSKYALTPSAFVNTPFVRGSLEVPPGGGLAGLAGTQGVPVTKGPLSIANLWVDVEFVRS